MSVIRSAYSRSVLTLSALIGLAFVAFGSAPAKAGGLSCSAGVSPTILTSDPYFVGDTIRLNLRVAVASIQGGTEISIPTVRHALDCANTGLPIILELCEDEGEIIQFAGNVATDCGVDWAAAPDATNPNEIVFTASPTLVLPPNSACNISFDANVLAISSDLTPLVIEAASGFDGVCDNQLDGQARGSLSVPVTACDVVLEKCVAVDTDNDGDFTDELCLSDMPATGVDGQNVQWRMEATNIGNGQLDDCTITDPDVPTDCAGFPIDLGTSFICEAPGVCDGTTEGTNTASVTCQICAGRELVTSDVDTADLVCLTPQIDIRKQEEGPDVRTFPVGADVPFDIEVCNTGEVDLTAVIVTDELVPGCNAEIGDLAVGMCAPVYECTAPGVVASFTNEVCVEGMSGGNPVMDCDPSTVEIIDIDIRKQEEGPDLRTFPTGSDVPFEIEVCNTGDEALTAVTVSDPLVPDCDAVIGDLAAGVCATAYTCTAPNVSETFTNEACVEGMRNGVIVTDCDPSTVEIVDIDIRKQEEGPDVRVFPVGSDVPFEIEVCNNGPEALTGVVVTDALAPDCDRVIGDLPAGTCADPYTCTAPAVTTRFINEACVEGMRGGVTVTDCDPSTVEIIDIDIRKQEEGPDSRTFPVGADVPFEIEVCNTGEEDLTGVVVSDPLVADCAREIGDLAAGTCAPAYTCTAPAVMGGFMNEACVDGMRGGVTVNDCDPSTVELIDVDIRKQEEGPDTRTFLRGSDVEFEVEVCNVGEEDLETVTITDALTPACDAVFSPLLAKTCETYTCTAPAVESSFTNEVCVEGEREGVTVEDCDPSTVEIIDIDIRKQDEGPDTRIFPVGADVPFEIEVCNTGDEDLTGVIVTDELAPDCEREIGDLAAGTCAAPYTCTVLDVTTGFTNEACVEGMRNGVTVGDCDPSTVEMIAIDIRKQEEGEDARTFPAGSDVPFEIEVCNVGEQELASVVITDLLVPDCDRDVGALPAGMCETYTCTASNVTETFTNEVCVEGMRDDMVVEDCDPSTVEIIDIAIRKQEEGPDVRAFPAGADVPFEIEVCNTGDEDLTAVVVTDELAPDCAREIGDLAAGTCATPYTCTLPGVTMGLTNEACVEGMRNGVTVMDCDPSTVEIIDIDIRKQEEGPDTRTFPVGSDVPFEIEVCNTGEQELTNVVITDELVPECARDIGTLPAGQCESYTCTASGVETTFTNEVCVEGMRDGITVEDCDPSTVEIIDIDIRKQEEGPDTRAVAAGSDVPFEIEVCNTGDEDLENVVVTDELAPDCERQIGDLAAGACAPTYTCTVTNVTTGFTNVACVEGMRNGVTVEDCDPSTIEIVSIDIRKQEEGPDIRTFPVGSDVPFEIEVCNTGEQDLDNVVITDELVPECARDIGTLPAGDCESYTCTATDVGESFTNEVCVEGMRDGVIVEDCDPSTVEIIDIDIRKQEEGPDTRTFPAGSDVPFEVEVCNTGDEDLSNVVVRDELTPDCNRNIGPLAAGACFPVYTCTSDDVTSTFTNEVCVEGSRNDQTVSDCDPSTVEIVDIDIRKQEEGPDVRTFPTGSDVTFEIEVCNDGDEALDGVTVTDPLAPDCERNIGTLAAGSCFPAYTCTMSDVDASFTNEACVQGMRNGVTVEDCDPSTVEIIDIDVRKQEEGPDLRTIPAGGDVEFEIEVCNTGDEDLSNVVVRDELAPDCNRNIGPMVAGSCFPAYTCVVQGVTAGFTNEVCVEGTRNGVTVDDCDPSQIQVTSVSIRKEILGPDSRTFPAGSDVTFEIEVCNTGEVDLEDVIAGDPAVPECNRKIGRLPAGECETYECTVENVENSFVNEICVEGMTPDGVPPDQRCDTSTVEIIDIDIRKQEEGPDTRTFPSGSDVDFEVEVCNTGDEDLSDVIVTDELTPDCNRTIGPLAAGACFPAYTCTAPNVTQSFTNEVCVSGMRNGAFVDDCDPSSVEIVDIDIRKQEEGPDVRTFATGSDVDFEIEACNTGNERLTDVVVTDALAPDCEREVGDLAPGACAPVYTCTVQNVTSSFVNEACVAGTRDGVTVEDCDPSTVEIIDIDIRKQAEGPDEREVPLGSDVEFEIEVCNTGDEDLANVVITDEQVPGCGRDVGSLAAGDCELYTCVAENVTETFTNEVCVEGSRDGVTVRDCDPSTVIVVECDIEVEKSCSVPDVDGQPTFQTCEGRVQTLLLEYTGLGCMGTTNDQGGRVRCAGDAGMAEGIDILATDDRGDEIYGDIPGVFVGDVIEISAFNAEQRVGGPRRIRPNTTITLGGGLEQVTFHTSCSQPLNVGDQFGSLRVVGMTTTEGGTSTIDSMPQAEAGGQDVCSVPAAIAEPHCVGRLEGLSFRYHGGTCGEKALSAADQFTCEGESPHGTPVRIVCDSRSSVFLDTGRTADVMPGHVVDMMAADGGQSDLPTWTDCAIYDEFGGWMQSVSLRTSCNKPINLGDRFGPLEVVGVQTTGAGVIAQGSQVVYTYRITNTGKFAARDVEAVDDKLGPLTPMPIPVIQPGETVVLRETALIEEDTTNVVTVTGEPECLATDSATVIVEPLALACRVTGGGNDVGYQSDNRYTFGGQAGAPGGSQPQPYGEWTHHQQRGSAGKFVFHAGTNSAPPGTEIDRITCSDPGFCQPARHAPAKQIDFEGVGTFRNIRSDDPALSNVRAHDTYHWFDVHIEDLGEPGSERGDENSPQCPPEGSAGELASCECLDFYHIRIFEAFDPEFEGPNRQDVIYEEFGYLDGGNLQIHPPLDGPGRPAATSDVQSVLLQYMGPSIDGPVTVTVMPKNFRNDPVVYEFPNGLATGSVISSQGEHGYTVDARRHREQTLGDVTTVLINGVAEHLQTGSAIAPLWVDRPAPLDGDPDMVGVPSPNWFVLDFRSR